MHGTTLKDLKPGERARVCKCVGEGTVFQRLCEMGFIEGTPVRVVRYAPLGDPMEVEIHDSHLSLRKAEAAMVHANELPPAAWGTLRSVNLPGLTATVAEMIEALRSIAGEAVAGRISFRIDEPIAAIVRSWPSRFDTARARTMGFLQDADFASILRDYMQQYAPAAAR